jgi:hypothetical protein
VRPLLVLLQLWLVTSSSVAPWPIRSSSVIDWLVFCPPSVGTPTRGNSYFTTHLLSSVGYLSFPNLVIGETSCAERRPDSSGLFVAQRRTFCGLLSCSWLSGSSRLYYAVIRRDSNLPVGPEWTPQMQDSAHSFTLGTFRQDGSSDSPPARGDGHPSARAFWQLGQPTQVFLWWLLLWTAKMEVPSLLRCFSFYWLCAWHRHSNPLDTLVLAGVTPLQRSSKTTVKRGSGRAWAYGQLWSRWLFVTQLGTLGVLFASRFYRHSAF